MEVIIVSSEIHTKTHVQCLAERRMILDSFAKLRQATVSFFMYVRLSAWKNLTLTGWIFKKIDFSVFLKHLSTKFKFH